MSEEKSTRDSIHALFDQYSSDVYRYARIMLNNEDDAKDVVQEVFIRAFRFWSGFRSDASPKTWLMSITRNCTFRLLGHKKREADFLANYEPPYVRDQSEILETLFTIEKALSQLKDTYRKVILLRHIENLPVQETANVLGWSSSKVTTTDQRAMNKLREILEVTSDEGGMRNEIKIQHS